MLPYQLEKLLILFSQFFNSTAIRNHYPPKRGYLLHYSAFSQSISKIIRHYSKLLTSYKCNVKIRLSMNPCSSPTSIYNNSKNRIIFVPHSLVFLLSIENCNYDSL